MKNFPKEVFITRASLRDVDLCCVTQISDVADVDAKTRVGRYVFQEELDVSFRVESTAVKPKAAKPKAAKPKPATPKKRRKP